MTEKQNTKETSLDNLCIEKGKQIVVKTTYRILLHDLEHVYFVEKGDLSVFFLFSREKGKEDFYTQLSQKSNTFLGDLIEGHLHYSANMTDGDFLFPFPLDVEKAPLAIATANSNSTLRKIPIAWLKEVAEHGGNTRKILNAIRTWLIKNSSLFFDKTIEGSHSFIEESQQLSFSQPTSISLAQYQFDFYPDRLWEAKIHKGSAQIGHYGFIHFTKETPALLLTPNIHLLCHKDTEVSIDYREGTKDYSQYWDKVTFFNGILSGIALQQRRLQLQTEKKNYKRLKHANEVILDKSIRILSSTLHQGPSPKREETASPIINTLEILAESFGKQIQIPYKTITIDQHNLLEYAKSACVLGNLFFQEINLPKKWLGYDSLPLAAFTKTEPSAPVAALPGQQGYHLYSSEKEPLKIKSEEAFHSKALAVYRSFPDKESLSWQDVLRFGFDLIVKDLWTVFSAAILIVFAAFFYPFATQLVFSTIVHYRDYSLLTQIAIGLIIVEIGRLLFQTAQEFAILRIEARLDHDMETAIWQRVLMMPTSFYRRYLVGSLMQRISAVRSIRKVLSGPLIRILIRAFFASLFLIMMLYYSISLTLAVVSILAVYFLFVSFFIPQSLEMNRKVQETQSNLDSTIIQTILGISKIRTNGAENRIIYQWSKHNALSLFIGRKLGFIDTINNSLNTTIPYLLQLSIMLVFMFWIKKTGTMDVGEFLGFMIASSGFTTGILTLSNIIFFVIPLFPTWERSEVIFKEPSEFDDKKMDPGVLSGNIRIDSLYFRYNKSSKFILENLTLNIKEGEFIALIGESGCGKSTLLRLLLGFEKPEHGAIYYDGKDLSKLNLNQLRRQLGTYIQNGNILDGTIRDNVLCGHYATDEEILGAMEKAGFLEDLRKFPMGLYTVLTSGGITLSGGQKQRLMLARALLVQHKILLLDEATNALDNKTQSFVIKNLENLPVTRIVIAHRLSTVKNANRILVLEKGKIIEEGTYKELLEKSPKLSELVKLQSLEAV